MQNSISNTRLILILSAVGVAFAFSAPFPSARTQNPQEVPAEWQPAEGPPPLEFWDVTDFGRPFSTSSGSFHAQVERNTLGKKLRIHWKHLESNTITIEEHALTYWPTAVSKANTPLGFCVAGKRDAESRNTVVELWVAKEPLWVANPGGDPTIVPQGVESVVTVYDAAVQGRDMVRTMQIMLGVENAIIMKFWGSNAVCTLDLKAPQPVPTLIASPSGGAGVLKIPALEAFHSDLQRMNHVTHGYCYYLTNKSRSGVGIVLRDVDRDGGVDDFVEIRNVHDWADHGFADSSNYHPLDW